MDPSKTQHLNSRYDDAGKPDHAAGCRHLDCWGVGQLVAKSSRILDGEHAERRTGIEQRVKFSRPLRPD